MLAEEITGGEIKMAVNVGKLSLETILKTLQLLVKILEKGTQMVTKTEDGIKHGKQTLPQLSRQNEGLSTIELKNPDLRELNKEMKKHGIDFSTTKDGNGKHTLFFKGKDVETMTHAFKQYTKKQLDKGKEQKAKGQDKSQSINKTLDKAKKQAKEKNKDRAPKEKNKSKGALSR